MKHLNGAVMVGIVIVAIGAVIWASASPGKMEATGGIVAVAGVAVMAYGAFKGEPKKEIKHGASRHWDM